MARKVRIEYSGAVYHVMARGNQGRRVFADDPDRKQWLQTLAEARELKRRPKNLREKQAPAWWLRQRTTVGRRWISERLGMGEESGVTRAVRTLEGSRTGELERMKRRLLRISAER